MSPPFPYAGEVFSLCAAVVWSIAVILLRKSGEQVAPLALNLFKNTVALLMLVLTMLAFGTDMVPDVPARDWAVLALSGLLGLGVADTLVLASLNRIGAGRMAIVDCLYSPSIFLCAWLLIDEQVPPRAFMALGLVVLAVLVGTLEPPDPKKEGPTRRDLIVGVVFGATAMLVMSIGITYAKPVIERVDIWWATSVRLAAGAAFPAVLAVARSGTRAEVKRAFTPGPAWRWTLSATFVGTYVSMVVWVAGFKWTTHATVAGILNQTSTIFTLILATVLLKEPLTGRRVIAIALGFAGAILASYRPAG